MSDHIERAAESLVIAVLGGSEGIAKLKGAANAWEDCTGDPDIREHARALIEACEHLETGAHSRIIGEIED